MSYCKAFAPCLRVTEGDRRVTGMTMVFNKPPNPLRGGTTDSAGTPPFRGQGGLGVLRTTLLFRGDRVAVILLFNRTARDFSLVFSVG